MTMNRRDFLTTAAAGVSLSVLPVSFSFGNTPNLPNIILCMADDQGWGDMGYKGHPQLRTPNFDAMSTASLRFDRFYAAAPVCTPTRGSVLTGRHPNRFGCFQWGHTLRPQEITIAEALKTKGYVTGHFGKWHVGSVQAGSPTNPSVSGFDEWVSAPNFFDNDPILSRKGEAIPYLGESSMVTVDLALEFIRKHAQNDHPFLAVVWFGSPHNPHEAVDEDRRHYGDEEERLQHFYGEITGMDRAFGTLRDELKTLGIHENTLLWYCSDNGALPNLGEAGGRGYKGEVYEGGLRVPAMLEWGDRILKPTHTDIPCSTVDIYPTLLDLVDIAFEHQPPLDGESLVPLIDGKAWKRSKPLGFWDYDAPGVRTPSKVWMQELLEAQQQGSRIHSVKRLRLEAATISKEYPKNTFPGHAAWLDEPWKLHRIQNKDTDVRWELYNLKDDPNEAHDLFHEQTQRATEMKNEFTAWLNSVVDSLNGGDYSST